MSCNIISASHASINGSSDAYGGYIVSASYMPSTINGYNKASVVLAGTTSTPAGNDEASIGIAGLELNMRVGSITDSVRAGSVSTTTIHYYDNSQILDNTHVLLKEEVAEGLGAIGDKYGPRPDLKSLNSLGLIVPASDTSFVKLRDFYGAYEVAGFNVDNIISSAPGKTIYTADQFMDAFGDILGDSFSIADGKMDFQGTLRQVIGQMCDTFGMVAYWDPETDTVVSSLIGQGNSTTSSDSQCTVIGSSTTSDYTASRAQGVSATFSTSNDGESQSSSGGNMSRFMKATLLQPKLKMKLNACGGEKIELNIFDEDGNTDEDIAKAMTAAQDARIYSMYVLQSVLGGDRDFSLAYPLEMEVPGKNNKKSMISEDLGKMLPLQLPAGNDFLRKYYKCQLDGVHLVEAPGGVSYLARTFDNCRKGWNENQGSSPYSIAGFFDGLEFVNGGFLFADKNTKSSILGEGLNLTGGGDLLRKLLKVLPQFLNKFYVLKSANAQRSAQTTARNYGYYIAASSSMVGQNGIFEKGWTPLPLNPWAPLSNIEGSKDLQDLAQVLYGIYGSQEMCGEDPLSQFTVIDFIYALEHDKLEELFSGNTTEAQAETAAQAANLFDQNHTMYLGSQDGVGANVPGMGPTTVTCFTDSEIQEIEIPSDVVVATEKIGLLSLGKDTILKDAIEVFDIGVMSTQHNIHPQIEPIGLIAPPPPSRGGPKFWFNVEGNSSWINSGPGQAFIGAGSLPPAGAWKSEMKLGLSVNAADLAEGAGINQSYLADTYDEGFTYSRQNIGIMAGALGDKVAQATWIDDAVGSSTSTTYLLIDDEMPDIPSVGEGLDSLSITTAGGKTELTITVGNANQIRARATLRDLKASSSHHQHSHTMMLPNVLNSAANTKIQSIANGNL